MSRPISTPRPSFFTPSRALRWGVEPGSMAYSAVSQPRPVSRKNGGTPSCTEAVHKTRVLPAQTSALPAAISVKPGNIFNSRSSLDALSFISIASVYSNSKMREDCVCMALSTISSATLAQAGRASVSAPGS